MSLSELKLCNQVTPLTTAKHRFFRPVTIICLLGLSSVSLQLQAANTNQATSPTASLQLINLQTSATVATSLNDGINDIDDFSDLDDISTPIDADGDLFDDDIDAMGDSSAVDNDNDSDSDSDRDSDDADFNDSASNDIDSDANNKASKVSLKAISPETLKTFVAVVDLVRREYVHPVNDETLFDNAMSGMLTKLDTNAEFLDAEAYDNLRAFTQGDVGDVGIKATYQPEVGYWVVSQVIDDSPADKKGITVGNYIHQIGEIKLDGARQDNDIEQLLTGIAGSQIDVVISKAGRRKRAITLQRNNTHPQMIQIKLEQGIAIIKLPAFQDNSREKILQGLIDLNAPIAGILLDLRDNPGGVLSSAIDVASLFMSDVDVVQVKSRQGEPQILSTSGSALLKSLPVVILQNRYSASAAEVLASSLQAQKRATIIGEISYGKGSIQSVIPVNDEQAVKLTVAHYLTATGVEIDKVGVTPNVTLSGSESLWQQQALTLLQQQVRTLGIRLVRKGSDDDISDSP